ncbi:MAG: thermonuclease family protein [Alphaproteobacteria bacterium]|nr:thermonuclease family protein [Alphaproteobacteria bacterium]
MKKILLSILACLFLPNFALASVRVLDGDSLRLSKKEEIRLIGIDAPEYKQKCYDSQGNAYDCGEKAKKALIKLVKGKKVTCQKLKKDIYKRDLSECFVGEKSLNLEMLKQGWAVVYRSKDERLLEAQAYAKENKLGMWQGKFMKPELWRALNRK